MSALDLLVVAPVVLTLFAAAVNYGVWLQRRSQSRQLALALSACTGLLLLAGAGLAYEASSRADAILARSVLLLGVVPVHWANVRRAERVYRRALRFHVLIGCGVPLVWACAGWVPGLLYADGTVLRGIGWLGLDYVDVPLTWLGRVAPLTLLPPIGALTARVVEFAQGHSDRRLVLATLLAAGGAAAIDLFTLGGWIDAPYCYGVVTTGVTIVYTALMLRHFVATLERVEASTSLLQRAAEARARELRESDLQLAHGVRLAALGTLAAGLAHEINNPVAYIRSNLNYLAEASSGGRDDAEFEEVLAETEQGVTRLRGIFDELLRMAARGTAGFGEVRLSDVVEAALPTLRFEARGEVDIEARLSPVPAVRGDRNLLGQVVANLALNAIQAVRATGAHGAVRIATFADDERVVLEVSDTGPGVAPEVAQRIFEPFFTTKPAGEGTGLGLAVCRQLVEQHGGRLALVPSERGARFQVELPILDATTPARARELAAVATA